MPVPTRCKRVARTSNSIAIANKGGGIGTRKLTGLLIAVENLHEPVYDWVINAVALTQIISIKETNMGIHRTLESYYNKSFHVYIAPTSLLLGNNSNFAHGLAAPHQRQPVNPGPVQFSGPLAQRFTS